MKEVLKKVWNTEHNIKQGILWVNNALNSFKLEFKEELHKIKKTIDDVKNSQEQLAGEYENRDSKLACWNYRPISILPLFSKIPEKLMHHRFMDYIIEYKFLYEHQFASKKVNLQGMLF